MHDERLLILSVGCSYESPLLFKSWLPLPSNTNGITHAVATFFSWYLDNIQDKLVQLVESDMREVYVTGYGIGGSIAQLISTTMKSSAGCSPHACYTFNTPTWCNESFAANVTDTPPMYRVYHNNDPVSYFYTPSILTHVGQPIAVSDNGLIEKTFTPSINLNVQYHRRSVLWDALEHTFSDTTWKGVNRRMERRWSLYFNDPFSYNNNISHDTTSPFVEDSYITLLNNFLT